MCDQDQKDHLPPLKKSGPLLEIGAPCVKCKANPITVLVRQAAYCDECFQEVTYHKYRHTVSKVKQNSEPERILVAVSTGQASRLMLYLTQLSKIQDPKRKRLDTFIPVHIVESDDEDRDELETFVKSFGLEYKEVPLYSIMSSSMTFDSNLINLSIDDESACKSKFLSFLSSAKTLTAQDDLIKILRKSLLTIIARKMGCRLLFLGDSNDRIAINIMSDVCAGRGATVPWSQLPLQNIGSNMGIVRPLRDLQGQEIPAFLKIIGKDIRESERPSNDTIYGLTDSFISGLAVDFSATPSIVTRTAAKVETEHTPLDAANLPSCNLCLCPMIEPSDFCNSCSNLIKDVPLLQSIETRPAYI